MTLPSGRRHGGCSVASRKAQKIANRMTNKIMRKSGTINKSYGSRQEITTMIMPVAEAVAVLDKYTRKYDRATERLTQAMGEHLDRFPAPEQGFTDYAPDRFVLQRRTSEAGNRRVNGHDPVPPSPPNGGIPSWHPENS